MKILKNIGLVLIGIMLIDMAGFVLWIIYGQVPTGDGYYFGYLTVHLLNLF